MTSLVVRKLARTDGHVIWTHAYKGYPDSYNAATRLALDPAGNVYCPGDATSAHGETREAMERTHRWARRSLAARGDSPQQLFAIVQGGRFAELRRESASELTAIEGGFYARFGDDILFAHPELEVTRHASQLLEDGMARLRGTVALVLQKHFSV